MKNYILLIITLLIIPSLSAQQLKDYDLEIKAGVEEILNNYQKYGSMSKDGKTIDKELTNSFRALFASDKTSMVYNDLVDDTINGKLLKLEDYIYKVHKNFIGGLSVSVDVKNITISKAYTFDKLNTYIVNVELTKKLFGLYQKTKIHDLTKKMVFRIVFDLSKAALVNFKIHEIILPENVPSLGKGKEEKFAYGIVLTPLYTQIKSTNINSNTGWVSKAGISINGGIDITYQFMPSLSLKSGLYYTNYKTSNTISNFQYRSTELTTDIDNDTYYKDVIADLEETNTISFIEIPIQAKYSYSIKSKLKLYLFGGLSVSYLLSAKYDVTGNSTLRGYYNDYNVLLEDIPEYGFETNTYNNAEGDWVLNKLNFFANIGIGVSIKTGFRSYLNIGPVANFSLNDLKYQEGKYKDDFYNSFGDPGKTSAISYGLSVSFMLF